MRNIPHNRGVDYYVGYFDGQRASVTALLDAIPHIESRERLLRLLHQISGNLRDGHHPLAETRVRGTSAPAAGAGAVSTE